MSKPVIAVLFIEGMLPRIYKNPFSIEDLEKQGTVLINPKFPPKSNPSHWEHKDGKIIVNRDKAARELPIYHVTKKEKTGLQLEQDIKDLDQDMQHKLDRQYDELLKIESKLLDKYNKLCNISVLAAFILLFLILNIDYIREIMKL